MEQYRERIRRYIRGMVRDRDEAEDLTQETFLRAHQRLRSLRDPAALLAWLYRIATHVCYDRFREASRGLSVAPLEDNDAEPADPLAPRLDQLLERAEMSTCVQQFLGALPDPQRSVLILHDVHGLTAAEAARVCGTSLEATKMRLHRARARLRAALAAGCEFSRDERDVFVCEPKRRP